MIDSVAVFCGSHLGRNPKYQEEAAQMGRLIAEQGLTLVYGGSNCGYMGVCSSAALEAGGRVVGVIPKLFSDEIIYSQPVTELVIVDSMAERKRVIAERCQVYIALPGGVGTLDELSEMCTNNQLGLARKPIGILNVEGFYTPLLQQLQLMVEEGFLRVTDYETVCSSNSPATLLHLLQAFK